MSDEIELNDKREPGFFTVDNEILNDYDLSIDSFYYYCNLLLHDYTGKAYKSKSALAKKHGIGRQRFINAERELIEKKLIAPSGKNENGIMIFDILKVKKSYPLSRGITPPVMSGDTNKTYNNTVNKTKTSPHLNGSAFPSNIIKELIEQKRKDKKLEPINWIGKQGMHGKKIKEIQIILSSIPKENQSAILKKKIDILADRADGRFIKIEYASLVAQWDCMTVTSQARPKYPDIKISTGCLMCAEIYHAAYVFPPDVGPQR